MRGDGWEAGEVGRPALPASIYGTRDVPQVLLAFSVVNENGLSFLQILFSI